MPLYNDSLEALIDALASLPGIGRRSATRLAYHLLQSPAEKSTRLAKAIYKARQNIHHCPRCFNLTDQELCSICASPKRDETTICVVEDARDIVALERTGEYKGLYHVLGGAISPVDGVGPNDLHIRELLLRLQTEGTQEVILATNPTVEGEATSLYLADLLKDTGIRLTRIAQGLPMGSDIKYADDITLARAFAGRIQLNNF